MCGGDLAASLRTWPTDHRGRPSHKGGLSLSPNGAGVVNTELAFAGVCMWQRSMKGSSSHRSPGSLILPPLASAPSFLSLRQGSSRGMSMPWAKLQSGLRLRRSGSTCLIASSTRGESSDYFVSSEKDVGQNASSRLATVVSVDNSVLPAPRNAEPRSGTESLILTSAIVGALVIIGTAPFLAGCLHPRCVRWSRCVDVG